MFQSVRPVEPKFRYHVDIAQRLLRARPNSSAEVVLDIGANVGTCTEMAASLGYVTIGVEAVSTNYAIASNALTFADVNEWASLVQGACWSTSGSIVAFDPNPIDNFDGSKVLNGQAVTGTNMKQNNKRTCAQIDNPHR